MVGHGGAGSSPMSLRWLVCDGSSGRLTRFGRTRLRWRYVIKVGQVCLDLDDLASKPTPGTAKRPTRGAGSFGAGGGQQHARTSAAVGPVPTPSTRCRSRATFAMNS